MFSQNNEKYVAVLLMTIETSWQGFMLIITLADQYLVSTTCVSFI